MNADALSRLSCWQCVWDVHYSSESVQTASVSFFFLCALQEFDEQSIREEQLADDVLGMMLHEKNKAKNLM